MPANKKNRINLLPQEEFGATTFGRILKWLLTTFRVMVIATELVVMGAFLSRFWLDAKNSDLNDELNSSKAQVLAYSDIESSVRLNQKKLNIIKSIYSQKEIDEIIDNLSILIPSDISLNSISINNGLLTIKSVALSERSIMQFLVNLEDNEDLANINLSQVSSGVENSYETVFTVTADLVDLIPKKGKK